MVTALSKYLAIVFVNGTMGTTTSTALSVASKYIFVPAWQLVDMTID